jgi:serine/threonine-protein kinase
VSAKVRNESAKIFRNLWQHTGDDERGALGQLAAEGPSVLADEQVVTRLQRRGLLRLDARGRARLFCEPFAEWLRESISNIPAAPDAEASARPSRNRSLTPHAVPGRYELIEEVGRGGAGTVFKAWDQELERVVAIKVLDVALRAAPERLERLLAEARACARLNDPYIVQVHDVDIEQGFLVEEFLAGGSLRDLLTIRPILARERVVDLVRQLASGLASAHRAGIVHRDLKPENVLFVSRPSHRDLDEGLPGLKIVDFGTALRLDLGDSDARLAGTLAYMAPEQLESRATGPPADLFSLGVLAWEALLGERPLLRDSIDPRIGELTIGDPVLSLVALCVDPDPGARPRDALTLISRLGRLER